MTIIVKFSPEVQAIYEEIFRKAQRLKVDRSILRSIDNKKELLRLDRHYGEPIAKKLIPEEYLLKYEATNLFRVELPDYWRMLYTIKPSENKGEIIVLIIDILDHKLYDRKFGYE